MNRAAMPAMPGRLLAACLVLTALPACQQGSPAQSPATAPLAGSAIGGPFTLTDSHGRAVQWSDFAGRYRVVYFGYTFCPDACPTDLARMSLGLSKFESAHPAAGAKVQPIFISVDPARDTPKVVGEFVANFHPRLIGLTGTPEQVKQAAGAFKVFYEKGESAAKGGYFVNHSTVTYLFGPGGEPLAMLPTDQGPDAVAAELAKWVS